MTNERTEALAIWRHHARKAEEAARNACNCRTLMAMWTDPRRLATPKECAAIALALASDATRYSLDAQLHGNIARTFRDGFQPIKRASTSPRCRPGTESRRLLDAARETGAMVQQVRAQFDQVGAL